MAPTAGDPARDEWVASGSARLAVTTWGSGASSRPPILALHAGVCDRRSWQWSAASWAQAGHRTVAYDRRGFGDTSYEPEQHDEVADCRAVSAATATRPAVVVGNSMGGMLALDLAVQHPHDVLALVLVGAIPSGTPDELWVTSAEEAAAEAALAAAEQSGDRAAVNDLEVHHWLDGPGQPSGRVRGEPRDLMRDMNARALAAPPPGDDVDRADAWPHLPHVTVPTLIVVGEYDEPGLLPVAEAMAERMPEARVRRMADTAHCPMLDRPDALAAEVTGFVESVTTGR